MHSYLRPTTKKHSLPVASQNISLQNLFTFELLFSTSFPPQDFLSRQAFHIQDVFLLRLKILFLPPKQLNQQRLLLFSKPISLLPPQQAHIPNPPPPPQNPNSKSRTPPPPARRIIKLHPRTHYRTRPTTHNIYVSSHTPVPGTLHACPLK
jgi:hypothetical protein